MAQDPDCIPLAVDAYREVARGLGDESAFAAFLEQCQQRGPYLAVVTELADQVERSADGAAASRFIMDRLAGNPTLGGFVALLERLDRDGQPLPPEQVALVRRFSKSLLDYQPVYRCRGCGFPSHAMMWQCPGCHEWGACRPVVRAEPVAHGR